MSDFTLGRVGIWTWHLDRQPMTKAQEAAAELEELGYGTLWVPEVIGREPMTNAALLLSATNEIAVGTGIANIYARSAVATQAAWKTLTEAFPERFLLGLGVSHPGIVEGMHGQSYGKPLSTMVQYLDAMGDARFIGAKPTTPLRCILAALGPRMLRLAADRTLGALAYFVPIEHTVRTRQLLGASSLLLVEQAVVLEPDSSTARDIARQYMATYLALPTYTKNLRRLGWTDEDVAGPSDALVDSIVAWGEPEEVAAHLKAHLDAGADHVAVQVVPADPRALPMPEWRKLADAVQGI